MLIPLRTIAHISIGMRFIATHDGSPPNLFLTALSGLLSKYSVHRTKVVLRNCYQVHGQQDRDHSDGGRNPAMKPLRVLPFG